MKLERYKMFAEQDGYCFSDKSYVKLADCLEQLKKIDSNSVDLGLTDPPYFIDGMDDNWNKKSLDNKTTKAKVIGSLPVGMKFDKDQGKKLQEFMTEVSKEMYRILKPGAFCLMFSQARLYHNMASALEQSGFEIRDMIGWTYEGQAKAFSMDHFIKKMKITDDEKQKLIATLGGRKTPQLKPMIEPIVLAQKPKEGTFIENWVKYGVGLIDTSVKWNDKFPGNIVECKKPSKKEKGKTNSHLTVKPLELMKHLIKVFSKEGDVVIDPFLGSGTTALAAFDTGREIIGIEKDINHYDISIKRIGRKIWSKEFKT